MKSRYAYLDKRQADKLADLELEIADEKYLFGDQKYVFTPDIRIDSVRVNTSMNC